jgi:undecaprenyl-diphosphatase
MPLDLAILKFINVTIANSAFDFFFGHIGDTRLWALPIFVIIVLLLWKGGPRGRLLVALSIITAIIVDSSLHLIIKPLFARPRPCHAEPAISWLRLINGCGGIYGFPSSHAANSFSQAMVIGLFYKSTRIYIYPLVFLISLSRVYLGVHYPSDILAGALYGALIGIVVFMAVKKIATEKSQIYFSTQKNPETIH